MIETAKSITSGAGRRRTAVPRARRGRGRAPQRATRRQSPAPRRYPGIEDQRCMGCEIEREDLQAEDEGHIASRSPGPVSKRIQPNESGKVTARPGCSPRKCTSAPASARRALLDESLRDDVHRAGGETREVLREPTARGRAAIRAASTGASAARQPHRVAVAEPERGKHARARVGHQRRIEVPQPAAAEVDTGRAGGRGPTEREHGRRRSIEEWDAVAVASAGAPLFTTRSTRKRHQPHGGTRPRRSPAPCRSKASPASAGCTRGRARRDPARSRRDATRRRAGPR